MGVLGAGAKPQPILGYVLGFSASFLACDTCSDLQGLYDDPNINPIRVFTLKKAKGASVTDLPIPGSFQGFKRV